MITNVLNELKIDFREHGEHHHTTEGWIQIDCPWCTPQSERFRMGIPENGWTANCFSCGKHGLVETLVEASEQSVKIILSLLHNERGQKLHRTKELHTGKLVIPDGVVSLLPAHRHYLKKRRIDPDEASALWGLKGIGIMNQHLKWRVFIPIRHLGKLVSWTTRSISDRHKHRYWSASPEQEAIQHKSLLFAEDFCKHAVIVCEGPLDVLRIGPGAVATFGSTYTSSQVLHLIRFPVRVICYDSEPTAQSQAQRLCEELSIFPGETIRVTLKSKDPGSCTPTELKQLRSMLK